MLGIAGQVASFAAQSSAANAANEAALANAQSASLAATHKYEAEGRRMRYDHIRDQQEGYKAVMAGRQAMATGEASAGAAGWDAGSISVGALLANEANKMQQNVDTTMYKFEDQQQAYRSAGKTYEAEAQGRINSMPMKPGPNPLALGINIAGGLVKGADNMGWFGA
jgi:hypothetical protein